MSSDSQWTKSWRNLNGKSTTYFWLLEFFQCLIPRKKSTKQKKIKITAQYVFLYLYSAHPPQFWWWSDENSRRISRKWAKFANFDHLVDPCDLDLVRMIKVILPGRSNILCQYILKFSRRSDNGKGPKRVWLIIYNVIKTNRMYNVIKTKISRLDLITNFIQLVNNLNNILDILLLQFKKH